MHELGIARDLWAIIVHNAEHNHLKNITKIVIRVGEASGVEIDFLRHSLVDHILPGSIAAGAQVEIVPEQLAAKCAACGREITKDNISSLRCPGCGGLRIDIISGKEAYVQSIEGT